MTDFGNGGIISCSDMILKTVDMTAFDKANEISSVWRSVLLKIKSYEDDENNERHMPIGERLAGNTRVVDFKKGVLLVEVDHSGWIQYLKMYQKFIITGIKRALPTLEIKSFAFRMAGTQVGLNDDYDEQYNKARQQMAKELDKQDEQLKQFYAQNSQNNNTQKNNESQVTPAPEKSPSENLPPELRAKFADMLKNMKE